MTKRTNEDEAQLAREFETTNAAGARSAREQAQQHERQAALTRKQAETAKANAVTGFKDGAHG
jgi:hypothetical protein